MIVAIATSVKQADGSCTVDIKGSPATVGVGPNMTVAVGDGLLIERVENSGMWFAVSKYGTAAISVPAPIVRPPTPKPAVTRGSLVVPAIQSISYQGSKWRTDNDDVYQGEYSGNGNHVGCWFYGTKPRSLDGATVTDVKIRLKRTARGGAFSAQPLTFWLLTQNKKPSGAPTRGSSQGGPSLRVSATSTFDLPNSWGQSLVDGNSGGIAIYESDGSPYMILEGRSGYSSSGTLTISWERNN